MQRVWDFLIGGALAIWWSYWVGAQCHVDAPWKILVITFVSGWGVLSTVVELRAALRDARGRRKAPTRGSQNERS